MPLDRETVERLSLERGEPAWLRESRLSALARYEQAAWPRSDVGEEWRRFPLSEVPRIALDASPLLSASRDGLAAGLAPEGVLRTDVVSAARAHPELLRRYLERDGGIASHAALRALAQAAWSEGTFVYVPKDVAVERPVEIVTGTGLSRTIVVADRGSHAVVVEDLTASDGTHAGTLAVPLLDVFLEDGATVEYVQLQRFGANVWNLGSQRYLSARDSRLDSYNVIVGGLRSKVGVESDIVGDGAVVNLYGLVAAGDDQKVDVNTFQDLSASHSASILLYLAALYDRAKAVFYGVIRVEPKTSGTSSYQECRNMLLSDHAGADPIPVLEILTNDVARCGHGATVGALDPAELFYVMSRGLPQDQAERLIVRGFFERVIGRVRDASVRRRMLEALGPRIGTIVELEEEAA